MNILTTTATSLQTLTRDVETQLRWIDGVEIRLDLLERGHVAEVVAGVRAMLPETGKIICTVRRRQDGGGYDGSESERFKVLRAAIEAAPDYVDLEYDLASDDFGPLAARADEHGVTIIWSLHDLTGVPEDLAATLDSMVQSEGGVAKVAVTPQSTADLLRLVEAADGSEASPRIVIGMGPYGTLTRVAPARFGSLLTFGSVPGAQAAPGHLSPQELFEVYRVGDQRGGWPLFAVVGNPVAHSRSPHYHNARFVEGKASALYAPLLVDEFSALMALADRLPLHGLSVTIPHKESALSTSDEQSPEAKAIGAANTLVRVRDGWHATNTDVLGFLAPLEEVQGQLGGLTALVLGAGGAARGVVYALARSGVNALVWNRTRARATELCAQLAALPDADALSLPRALSDPAELEDAGPVELVVNTTSLGMHGEGDPAPWYSFHGTELVYDIVYTPPETPLVKRAAAAGCRVITGDRMFAAQAAAQFELFFAIATGFQDGD